MMNQNNIKFSDYVKLAHKLTRTILPRVMSRGVAMDYDDIFQEVSVSFVLASEKFEPSRGIKFSTYFGRAVMLNINRVIDGQADSKERDAGFLKVSLDSVVSTKGNANLTLMEVVASGEDSPEDVIIGESHRAHIISKMTPVTRQVFEMMENPPVLVEEEFRAVHAKAALEAKQGAVKIPPRDITLNFIMKLMGLSLSGRREVCKEIQDLTGVQVWKYSL